MKLDLINTRLQTRFYFLFCLPVFFIFHGYNELHGFLEFPLVSLNLAIVGLFVLGAYAGCKWYFKDNRKAALFSFFICCSCLFFGSYHDFLKSFTGNHTVTKYRLILPILLSLFLLSAVLLKKTKKSYSRHTQFINILMIILLLVELADGINKHYRKETSLIDNRFVVSKNYRPSNITDSLKPDIFFFVFDELASSNGLLKHIGKNNKALDSILEKKNFFIADESRSNYNMTMYSVATTLNMEYLPQNISPRSDHTKYFFSCFESLTKNSLIEILKKENYSIHHIQNLTFSYRFEKELPYFNDFRTHHYFYKTLLGRIARDISWNFSFINNKKNVIPRAYRSKDRLIRKQISALKKECTEAGNPKFIYAHFMLPHSLYIYDSTGQLRNQRELNTDDNYYQQLLYTNKLIKDMVDYIQTHNKKNTIIVVEGDHGYHALSKTNNNYYFENFSAFYFPDNDYSTLYKTITPVNSFRVILNKYFDARLPILQDTSILVANEKKRNFLSKKIKD